MTSDVSEVLAPCPFCGSGARFVKHSAGVRGTMAFDSWDAVACAGCGATVGACDRRFRNKDDARKAWNTRAQPAVLAVPGWRPIESAPKDGRLILLNFGTKGVRAVSWDSPWGDPVTEENGIWCVDDDKHGPYPMRGYNDNSPTAPTHWLPLPAAPAIHEGGEHA